MFQTKVLEKINTHFMFHNVFPKIAPLMRSCRKIWWRPTGHRFHSMAYTCCNNDSQTRLSVTLYVLGPSRFLLTRRKFGISHVHKNVFSDGDLRKSRLIKTVLRLRDQKSFYLHFPHFLSNFFEIR